MALQPGERCEADLIYLWLNPMVDIVANGKNVKYTLSTDGAATNIQWLSVGQLKNPSTRARSS